MTLRWNQPRKRFFTGLNCLVWIRQRMQQRYVVCVEGTHTPEKILLKQLFRRFHEEHGSRKVVSEDLGKRVRSLLHINWDWGWRSVAEILLKSLSLVDSKLLTKNSYDRNLSSLVKPIISSKLKPNASKTWSNVECK